MPVVLEAGIAGTSLGWSLIDEALAADARVLSYDRAGPGWSDSSQVLAPSPMLLAICATPLRAAGILRHTFWWGTRMEG